VKRCRLSEDYGHRDTFAANLIAAYPQAFCEHPYTRLLVRSEAWRASVERDAAAPSTSINAEPMPLRRIAANLHTAMQMPCRFFGSAWQLLRFKDYGVICLACGAPEEIRTPDPQIRSWGACSRHCQLDGFEIEAFVMSSRPGFVTKGSLPSKFRRVQVAAAKYRR